MMIYIFYHISLLRVRNVSGDSCREHQNTHSMLNIYIYIYFFFGNRAVYEMWKNIVAGQATYDYVACALHAGYWAPKAKITYS